MAAHGALAVVETFEIVGAESHLAAIFTFGGDLDAGALEAGQASGAAADVAGLVFGSRGCADAVCAHAAFAPLIFKEALKQG